MSKHGSDDDKVGYCRPPKKHQFRKGQSGNPAGRKKGSKNFETIIRDEMNRPVTVSDRGERRTISRLELIIRVLSDQAAQGKIAAFRELMRLALPVLQASVEASSTPGSGDSLEIPDEFFAEMLQAMTRRQDQ
jgi:hypothetical protein